MSTPRRDGRAVRGAQRGCRESRREQPGERPGRSAARAGAAPAPRRDVRIRPSVERDLPGISALFSPPLDVARLRWLLTDPTRERSLRSFVAEDGDRVVGPRRLHAVAIPHPAR